RGGNGVNLIMIVEDTQPSRNWGEPGEPEVLRASLRRWAPAVRAVTDLDGLDWRTWAMFDRAPERRWVRGRSIIIGDAAHPMVPFLAQGGAMAIEDGYALATAIAGNRHDIPGAFRAFAMARMSRTARVQSAARRNGDIFHESGPVAFARDVVMRGLSGDLLLRRFDWLYGHCPAASLPKTIPPQP
ncbi:MAG: FAD-dependent monooxygenase, partial [Pseudomonadota bacterium]